MSNFTITANYVAIFQETIYPAKIQVENGKILAIEQLENQLDPTLNFILPGFVDAHIHIESSMLVPSEFARLATVHGSIASVSDPHEIANVLGVEGIDFMIENGKQVPFKFFFGAPSCVPATTFETAGAILNADEVSKLLQRDDIYYLAEMMNFPGVIQQDEEVIKKINAVLQLGKAIDGHAPGLRGENAKKYIEAGKENQTIITTDHECFIKEEALDKLRYGMKIQIREGSAAKNFEALIDLLHDYPTEIMFCSDDKHPDNLEVGHINELVKRALKKGVPLFHVLQAACVNPVLHYKLPVGLLRKNDSADFILIDNIEQFNILETYIEGELVAKQGQSFIPRKAVRVINQFNCTEKQVADFRYSTTLPKINVDVIEALDGQLITNKFNANLQSVNGNVVSDTAQDILKLTVVNRYNDGHPAISFIKNFGIKGAIASTVAHDSHNIIAVGSDDETICRAVNLLVQHQGGICAVSKTEEQVIPLPIAGLMSDQEGKAVAKAYTEIDLMVKRMGSKLESPFMTLSFMALLVIPHLKLSDQGLFDGDTFSLIEKKFIEKS